MPNDPKYDRTRVFTHSNVETFDACPFQFKGVYVDGLETDDESRTSPYARRGTAFHEAVADYFKNIDTFKPDTPKTFWEAAKVDATRNSPAEDHAPLTDLFKTFEQKHGNPPEVVPVGAKLIGAEVPFGLDAKGALTTDFDAFRVAGTIDLLYRDGDTLVVLDWKTGHSFDLETPIELNHQMRLYGYAAALMVPDARLIRPILDYIQLDGTYPSRPIEFPRETFLETAWPWMAARTGRIIEAIQAGKFPARPNENCGYCPVRDKCKTYQNALLAIPDDAKLDRPAQVLKLIRLCDQAEDRLKEYRAMIRAWIEKNGPIVDEEAGKAYKFIPSSKYDAETDTIISALLSLGLEKDGARLDGKAIRQKMNISKAVALSLVKDFTEPRSEERKNGEMAISQLYEKSPSTPKLQWVKEETE